MPRARALPLLALLVLPPACATTPAPPASPGEPESVIAEDAPAIPATAFDSVPGVGRPLAEVLADDYPAPPDVAAPPNDAEKLPSGLASKRLVAGTGSEHPTADDEVTVHYSGWTTDGRLFDSSHLRGETAHFGLRQVIKGWTQGLPLMVVGEKRRFWIPAELAYGDDAVGGSRPAGTLVFDVELLDIKKGIPTPPVPADVAAPPRNARKTKSGLAYRVLVRGKGKRPGPSDTVKVHFTGWTSQGEVFDSSVPSGEARRLPLPDVIPGWREALQLMHEGETARLWVPPALAYGDPPEREGVPAGTLVFDMQLVAIEKTPKAPPAPKDVAAPPRDALRTASGLAYRVLRKGGGERHPNALAFVKVHYTGWTADGKLFDSSIPSGEPVRFAVSEVVPGFGEGVQLMVVGEKTRFWIPAALAYGEHPQDGQPAGMLVFDVELVAIESPPPPDETTSPPANTGPAPSQP